MNESIWTFQHLAIFLGGSTALGIVAHAVNTFPTPENKYGAWFLALLKFAVGQRISAANAMQGLQTVTIPVTNDQKTALATHSSLRIVETPADITNAPGEAPGKTKTV